MHQGSLESDVLIISLCPAGMLRAWAQSAILWTALAQLPLGNLTFLSLNSSFAFSTACGDY